MSTGTDYLYYYQPLIDMKGFIKIMLASLADKSQYFNGKKVAILPIDCSHIIEKVLYQNQDRMIEFSKVMSMNKYYYHQVEWEEEFEKQKQLYLKEKTFKIRNQNIEAHFKEEEIEDIFFEYDEETLQIMDDFTDLLKEQINKTKTNRVKELKMKIVG